MQEKKIILLTGASSGIGKYLATQLSKDYNLILNGRDQSTLDQTLNDCENRQNHYTWVADLNEINSIESSLTTFLSDRKITISIFIHCAGFLKMVPLKSLSIQILENTMNINFNSAVIVLKSLISKKINSGLENVVFISSTASVGGAKAFNAYSGSKAALDGFMRSIAVELAPKVRVNSILPGSIETKMTQSLYENAEVKERMAAAYPLGLGNPVDIYEMINFLISDKSKWITGQQFIVDGGRTINISG